MNENSGNIFKTFVGYNIDGFVKIGIDGLMGSFSDRETSHKGSWPVILKNQLKWVGYENVNILQKDDKWENYDIIVIDWGMEFKGVFNVFGGASDEIYRRLKQFLEFKGKIFSSHIPCPDIADFVSCRLKTGTDLFKTLNPEDFKNKQEDKDFKTGISWFEHVFASPKVCLGDSHILSAYHPGYMIFRNDGMTLHGALKRGLKSLVPDYTQELVVYFSNIDIRHHLCRFDDPTKELLKLLSSYEAQLVDMDLLDVSIVAPLPIEFEERKLPKTGYYKDTPFFGSREERLNLVHLFYLSVEEMCGRYGWNFLKWPNDWYFMDPKEFAETHMEAKQSVHLRRSSYMYDLETNALRFSEVSPEPSLVSSSVG